MPNRHGILPARSRRLRAGTSYVPAGGLAGLGSTCELHENSFRYLVSGIGHPKIEYDNAPCLLYMYVVGHLRFLRLTRL